MRSVMLKSSEYDLYSQWMSVALSCLWIAQIDRTIHRNLHGASTRAPAGQSRPHGEFHGKKAKEDVLPPSSWP